MKLFISALAVLLLLPFQSVRAASQDEEARFLAAAKAAFERHDADALMALTCWDRVPDKLKDSGKKQYARDVVQTATDITLINPDPKFPDLEWKDTDGVAYRSNLPVIKQLKITFAPGGRFKDGTYPVGEKDGQLYLLAPAPVKIGSRDRQPHGESRSDTRFAGNLNRPAMRLHDGFANRQPETGVARAGA